MEHRVTTIFEVAEEAERQLKKSQPQAGEHKLKAARKASGRTLQRPKPKQQKKRKGG